MKVPKFAVLYLALAIAALVMWHRTGGLPWALGAGAFAVASITETLRLLKRAIQQG